MDVISKRVCNTCHHEQDLERFPVANKRTGRRSLKCETCTATYASEWYQKNKDRTRSARLQAAKRWRAKKKAEAQAAVNEIKSGPCADCHLKYQPWQMQFDHRDGNTKKFNVASAVHHAAVTGMEAILEEIAKCDLVCANCHADRTYRRAHPGV